MKSWPKVKLGKIIVCPLFGVDLFLLAPLYTILTHYVFLINFSHNMLHLWKTSSWKFNDLDLTYQCHPMSNFVGWTERPYMPYYMCFIQTFIIRCTVSEILAEIDHKCPNWTFLTFKMTLNWIHTFHILGQNWFHNKATWCNKFGQHFVTTE